VIGGNLGASKFFVEDDKILEVRGGVGGRGKLHEKIVCDIYTPPG
jgi:hypothetical protein